MNAIELFTDYKMTLHKRLRVWQVEGYDYAEFDDVTGETVTMSLMDVETQP